MTKNGVILRAASLALLVAAVFSLYSCKKPARPNTRTFYGYFDTETAVYDYSGGGEEEFLENCTEVTELLKYYHRLFDIYNEYDGMTNLATVNRLAGQGAIEVPRELIDFLAFSVEMHTLTDGNVNIAMGAVLSLWHDARLAADGGGVAAIPSTDALSKAAEHCDISDLKIDADACTVELLDSEMSLDVGAIAKGYAAERAAEFLGERGCDSYVLDLGGNLRIIGTKPDGSTWRTGVRNPDTKSSEPYVYYLDVADTSVVTSGDYQRYYVVDGKKYHHIINKDTLMPAEYFASVTVVCDDSGLADALSTALFNMDYEQGRDVVSSLDAISVVWVFSDGEVKTFGLD